MLASVSSGRALFTSLKSTKRVGAWPRRRRRRPPSPRRRRPPRLGGGNSVARTVKAFTGVFSFTSAMTLPPTSAG